VGDFDGAVIDPAAICRDALLALTALGFKKLEAQHALAVAQTRVAAATGLEPLLRAALRELR
jgi:Holliday junction resolvasome RuvABC DNA-binding subunit